MIIVSAMVAGLLTAIALEMMVLFLISITPASQRPSLVGVFLLPVAINISLVAFAIATHDQWMAQQATFVSGWCLGHAIYEWFKRGGPRRLRAKVQLGYKALRRRARLVASARKVGWKAPVPA